MKLLRSYTTSEGTRTVTTRHDSPYHARFNSRAMQAARTTIAPRPTHINSLLGGSSGSSRRAAGAARMHPVAGPSAEKSNGKKRAAAFDYKAAARQRLGWGAAGGVAVHSAQQRAEAEAGDEFDNV